MDWLVLTVTHILAFMIGTGCGVGVMIAMSGLIDNPSRPNDAETKQPH